MLYSKPKRRNLRKIETYRLGCFLIMFDVERTPEDLEVVYHEREPEVNTLTTSLTTVVHKNDIKKIY